MKKTENTFLVNSSGALGQYEPKGNEGVFPRALNMFAGNKSENDTLIDHLDGLRSCLDKLQRWREARFI